MKRWICILLAVALLLGFSACKRADEETAGTVDQVIVEPGRVELAGGATAERITTGALAGVYDYDIYYYGIKNFSVDYDGTSTELRNVLQKDPGYIDRMITRAEQDADDGLCILDTVDDGGTRQYRYEKCHIIKRNSNIAPAGVNRDVIISIPTMDLSAVFKATEALLPEQETSGNTENGCTIGTGEEEPEKVPEEMEPTEEQEETNKDYTVQGTCGTVNNPVADKIEFVGDPILWKITVGELENVWDYDIYYYGVSDFYIEPGVEFQEALKANAQTVQALLDQCDADAKEGICTKSAAYDGGSVMYDYKHYKILKLHAMVACCAEDGTLYDDYQEALIIGSSGMTLGMIEERMADWKGIGGGLSSREEIYVYEASADPIKPKLMLGTDSRFIFTWSALSSYRAVGTYLRKPEYVCLTTDDRKYEFVFDCTEDGLVFNEHLSTPLPKYKYSFDAEPRVTVPDGAVFKKQ